MAAPDKATGVKGMAVGAVWRRRVAIALGVLTVLALAFWLKVEHAKGVCDEARGRWVNGDCVFEENWPK